MFIRNVPTESRVRGAVARQHEEEHDAEQKHEDRGLQHVGDDRAAQPALHAVEEGRRGEEQSCADEGGRTRCAVEAADHRRIAPDLVVEPDQDRGAEGERGEAPVLATSGNCTRPVAPWRVRNR